MGVTLYLSLTKELPFPRLPEKESEAWVTFIKRSEKPLECPFDHSVFNQHPELVPMLRRALANNPKRRHASARAMRDEIQGILGGWERKQAYDAALVAGRTALDQQDYNEAERQAERALELKPRDHAAKQLFSQAQAGKLHKQSVATVEEQPTAITKGSVGGERAEEATAETRPADVNRILEYEEAVREEQKKREQAEREQAEKEKLRKDEERRQAVEVRRRRIKACIPWMVKAAAVLVLGIGLYYGWRVWELSREKQHEQNYQAAMEAGQKAYGLKDYDTTIQQADVALANKSPDEAATRMKNAAQAHKTEIAERERKYQAAMEAGQKAYDLKDYDTAIEQADMALSNKSGDAAATKLKNAAQARKTEIAERDRKYQAAMEAGQKAYGLKDYDTTIQQADVALAEQVPGRSGDENEERRASAATGRNCGAGGTGAEISSGNGGGPEGLRPEGLRHGDPAGGRGAGEQSRGYNGNETEERRARGNCGADGAGQEIPSGDGGGSEGLRPEGLRHGDQASGGGAINQFRGCGGDETEERGAKTETTARSGGAEGCHR